MSINQYDGTVRNKEAGGILRPTPDFFGMLITF